MQIVTDRGADLTPEQSAGLNIYYAPLRIHLDDKVYSSGVDLQPDEFYALLSTTESFPTTSQPSSGEFAEIYRDLAAQDPEILSIHISSGLSGTLNSARAGAMMVPEARVTFIDTLTLSVPEGWQVQAAARALAAGWPVDQIKALLGRIQARSDGIFTVPTLRYLIHGGRISHLKGLIASLLSIKPVIGVEKENGTYITLSQEVLFRRALSKLADVVAERYSGLGALRIQLLHGKNLEGVEVLREKLASMLECVFEPVTAIAPVLGAHTGSGLVGLAVAPISVFEDLI